VAQWILDRL